MVVARTHRASHGGPLLLIKPADLVLAVGLLVFALCASLARTSGWKEAAAIFSLLALCPIGLRIAAQRWQSAWLKLAADFFPTLSALIGYGQLNPVCDFFHQPLADGKLQQIDQALFGMQPAVALSSHLGPALSNVLMACYCSYYAGPFFLGVALYALKGEASFDRWCTVVCTAFLLNWVCYFIVPAVGPRFALTSAFTQPIQGALAVPLSHAFADTSYHRDCFPSGHTALTLLVLGHSWRRLRPFFWIELPIGLGLIVSTIALRFHYGIDVLAAVPFAIAANAVGERFFRSAPLGWAIFSEPLTAVE